MATQNKLFIFLVAYTTFLFFFKLSDWVRIFNCIYCSKQEDLEFVYIL